MLVFMPMTDILNIPGDYQFVFSVGLLDEQCFTPHFMQWVTLKVHYIKCDVPLSQGSW